MSYDLIIVDLETMPDLAELLEAIEQTSSTDSGESRESLSDKLASFLGDVGKVFPAGEDDPERSPWAVTPTAEGSLGGRALGFAVGNSDRLFEVLTEFEELAVRHDLIIYDPQKRTVRRPATSESDGFVAEHVEDVARINRLTMTWLLDPSADIDAAPMIFLDTCRELLAPAVPIAVGNRGPLRSNFTDAEFAASWFSAPYAKWRPSAPFSQGCAVQFDSARTLSYIEVRLDSVFLDDPEHLAATRTLFYRLANRLGCFYAEIAVERDAAQGMSARVSFPPLVQSGAWRGLPLGDLWLTYFEDDYADLLGAYLPLVAIGSGHGHEFIDAWQGRERRADTTFAGLVPAEYLVSLGNNIITGEPIPPERIHGGMIPKDAEAIPERLRLFS